MSDPDRIVVRWGVLAPAKIARRHMIPAMHRAPSCEVVALAGRDEAVTAGVAAELDVPTVHASLDDLVTDPHVDAVYVPLPNHLHAEWTIRAARAGKHVLCEKPLALTAADARRVVTACRDAGVLVMEGYMYRLHPSWVTIRDLIRRGRIGALTAVDVWFSYVNTDPRNIRNVAAFGGGALFDVGGYGVDAARFLLGAEPTQVRSRMVRDRTSGVDVLTSAVLGFDGGRTATFTVSTRLEPDQRVQLYGERGRVTLAAAFNPSADRPSRIEVFTGGRPVAEAEPEVLEVGPADPYELEVEAFSRAVLDGGPVPIPPTEAVATLSVVERIEAAAG